jgi:hypothetical protein
MEQPTFSVVQSDIILSGVQGEYKSLDEIKPVLVNKSGHSIYLLPEDCGEARLSLFYMNKNWRTDVSPTCSKDTAPIEVKSDESYPIPSLVWRPLITREGKLIERKNFPGRYKIIMRYTLEPVEPKKMDLSRPKLKFRKQILTVSQEFIIAQ